MFQFNWKAYREIEKTKEGIAFMSAYYQGGWKEANEIGDEFTLSGQFIGERYIERTMICDKQTLRELAKEEYKDLQGMVKNDTLFSFSARQQAAKLLGDIFSLPDSEMEIISDGESKGNQGLYSFIEFKLGDVRFAIIKEEGSPPKIKSVRLDPIGPGYIGIKTLFSDEREKLLIKQAMANAPKMRLKWLF